VELRHLITFRAAATSLSFTAAAADLGYVQSAVTGHIKALERELGVPLFDRHGRGVALTDAGRRLLSYADRITHLAEEAAGNVGSTAEPAGTVTVSTPEVLAVKRLPAVVRELYRRHPGVQIAFRANPTGALDQPVRLALASGAVDVAYVLAQRAPGRPPLVAEHLIDEPLILIAAPSHPLARRKRVTPADIDGVAIVTTEPGCPYRTTLDTTLAAAGARARIVGEFTSSEAVKRCVEAGSTVALLAACSLTEELLSGSLKALSWRGPALQLASFMVWNSRRWTSPALDVLLRVTRETFGSPEQLIHLPGGRYGRGSAGGPLP
jgi:DNA-binding transcriptional LysR family regulator